MATEEGLNWGRVRSGRGAGGDGAEELQKLLPGVGGEAVGRVGDDVGVRVLGEVETYGEAVRAGVGVVVGDQWEASGVGETHRDRSGRAGEMRCAGEGGCAG